MGAAEFSSFIRGIERRLIGFLRFASLDSATAEDLFIETCAQLRERWPLIAQGEHESAAFELALEAVRRSQCERSEKDDLSIELAQLPATRRQALCMATFGPTPLESELGRRMLKQAPAPSLPRQIRVTRSKLRSLAAVGLSLCVCLALVAGFAALHGSVQPPPEVSKPPEDWLGDQIAEVARQDAESTFFTGALAEPALGEELLAQNPVVEFDVLVPKALPRGFRLVEVKHFKPEETGLDFNILRLTYAKGEARLVLLEAESGFPWRSEFNTKVSRNTKSVQRYGTAVLAISNAFDETALDEIAAQIAPRK